jgi:hypothetical protein
MIPNGGKNFPDISGAVQAAPERKREIIRRKWPADSESYGQFSAEKQKISHRSLIFSPRVTGN